VATEAMLLEDCVARMKRRGFRKSAAKKIVQSRITATKSRGKRRLSGAGSKSVTAKGRRARTPTVKVKAAAKRVLVSAGRAAKSLARAGGERVARVGRKIIARGAGGQPSATGRLRCWRRYRFSFGIHRGSGRAIGS
jgi:hypothetical protein